MTDTGGASAEPRTLRSRGAEPTRHGTPAARHERGRRKQPPAAQPQSDPADHKQSDHNDTPKAKISGTQASHPTPNDDHKATERNARPEGADEGGEACAGGYNGRSGAGARNRNAADEGRRHADRRGSGQEGLSVEGGEGSLGIPRLRRTEYIQKILGNFFAIGAIPGRLSVGR